MSETFHEPVLTKEVINFLNCKPGGIYIDVTLGGGGWAEAILDATKPDGKLIGFDRDTQAIVEAQRRLESFSNRFRALKAKFSDVDSELKRLEVDSVDGIVADLGVSSYQFGARQRGFSFSQAARLDMRMDEGQELTAYELVNESSADQLADWFFEYGEERYSRRIARAIIREREKGAIETTTQLAEIVLRAVPRSSQRWRIHPATRVFQAIRVVVNDEVNELRSLIQTMPPFLNLGGRMIVVSYHSLEDRVVKTGFLGMARTGKYIRITKKPVRPSEKEVERNRRARSARLRVLERI